jgi:hypothetical protein
MCQRAVPFLQTGSDRIEVRAEETDRRSIPVVARPHDRLRRDQRRAISGMCDNDASVDDVKAKTARERVVVDALALRDVFRSHGVCQLHV